MTRDNLRHLEGQLVIVSARRAGHRRTSTGNAFDQQRNCRIWRWDGCRRLPARANWSAWGPPAAVVDHLWVEADAAFPGVELLETGWSAGRIGWYRRADGSVDLGLRVIPTLVMEDAMDGWLRQVKGLSTSAAAAQLETLLRQIEQLRASGAGLLASCSGDTDAVLADGWSCLAFLQRSAAAEARARAGALAARRGTTPRGIELFPVPSTRRRRPVGIRPMAGAAR